jgi:PAS domain S-box-containing protein
VQASAIAVSFTDLEARFVWANDAFSRITGYALDELVGRPVALLRSGEHDDAFYDAIWALISKGEVWRGQIVRRRRDGGLYLADLTVCPVLDETGKIVNFIDYHNDITRQRELETRVAQAERLASVGMLTAGVAHEVNNPLAYAAANVGLVLEELERGLAPDEARSAAALELLREARGGIERAKEILRDLRVFARADDTGAGVADVHASLDAALGLVATELRHRARVSRSYGDVAPVHAAEGRLVQVFVNLLLNAAQALEGARQGSAEVRVATRMSAEHVVVEIADTGPGIARADQERVFEPFFTTKPPGIGTGLGLAICRGIVGELGGSIELESELGQGATFRVVLPAASEPIAREASAPAPPGAEALATRRGRVLVVDDEAAVATSIRRVLGREHDVCIETSARAALARLERGEIFDVILCDLMMPELSGVELYDELTRRAPSAVERMVFLTGGAFGPRAREFLRNVANTCLAKPFDNEALRRLIRERVAALPPSASE